MVVQPGCRGVPRPFEFLIPRRLGYITRPAWGAGVRPWLQVVRDLADTVGVVWVSSFRLSVTCRAGHDRIKCETNFRIQWCVISVIATSMAPLAGKGLPFAK